MPNRQYEAGDRFEKRVMTQLEKRDYLPIQSRSSKGAFDICAIPDACRHILFIQVKGGEKKTTHSGWNALYEVALKVGGLAVIADRDGRNIRYRLITGYHQFRSRDWPAESYEP